MTNKTTTKAIQLANNTETEVLDRKFAEVSLSITLLPHKADVIQIERFLRFHTEQWNDIHGLVAVSPLTANALLIKFLHLVQELVVQTHRFVRGLYTGPSEKFKATSGYRFG